MRFPFLAICKIVICFCAVADRGPLAQAATIHFPPMLLDGRHGSYDVSVERTEFAGDQEFPALTAKYHLDVGDGCARTIVREFSLNPQPLHKIESIFDGSNGSILNINTENGKTPSQVTFSDGWGNSSDFLANGYGVGVINGCFANHAGILWDEIERIVQQRGGIRARITVAPGIDATLEEHSPDNWRVAQVTIRMTNDRQALYGPKLYHAKAPAEPRISVTEELDCEYGPDDSAQTYRYEIRSSHAGDQVIRVVEEISVNNYSDQLAAIPISADGAYQPVIVDIPNGTPVGTDDPAVDYEWEDGHIVKSIDASAVAAGQSARFSTSRQLLVVNVVLFAAVITGLLVRRACVKKEAR